MRPHTGAILPLAAAIVASLSCSDSTVAPPPVVGPQYPSNALPASTIRRFVALYETKDAVEYPKLFTGDFRFEFSNSADPGLVILYPGGWTKYDERIAAQNLFQGGVNAGGGAVEAAQVIELSLTPTTPVGDGSAGKDSSLYKTLLASIELQIDLPSGDRFVAGEAPPQTNRFDLVRGDAAVGLEADQPADSLHWYVYRWRDESPPLKPSFEPEQSEATTWGRLKALYR